MDKPQDTEGTIGGTRTSTLAQAIEPLPICYSSFIPSASPSFINTPPSSTSSLHQLSSAAWCTSRACIASPASALSLLHNISGANRRPLVSYIKHMILLSPGEQPLDLALKKMSLRPILGAISPNRKRKWISRDGLDKALSETS
ncbi:hypothetical protein CBS147332_7262 [Penicillium roqueforti]|nr:hypothetical protein CBS147332_7262 [Penicillium roqueforti]KAI3118521.1 hypothetical protein CBS147331_3460 [Penicillium roqueforti]